MIRRHQLIASAYTLYAFAAYASTPAIAQYLFVTSNRTAAGGNPVNGPYNIITVGADAANTAFSGVTADITGGSAAAYINATNMSLVNISAGTFGTVQSGGSFDEAVLVQRGSTVNLTGGTFNSYADLGDFNNSGLTSTLNISGGTTLPYIFAERNAVVNMTGGSVAGIAGSTFSTGVLGSYDNSTLNVTGGRTDEVFLDYTGTVNFGGTAATASFQMSTSAYGIANITGGTIGNLHADWQGTANVSGGAITGGISLASTSLLNLSGSGLTVSAGAVHTYWDSGYFTNSYVRDYTVSGTLGDGTSINKSFTAAADYTASSSLLSFNGTGLDVADDIYVTADQTVTGVHNSVTIGYDSDGNPFNPSVQIVDGTDVGFGEVGSASTVHMTGGLVHDLNGEDTSDLTVNGTAKIDVLSSSSLLTVAGGTAHTIIIGLGSDSATLNLLDGSTTIVEGTGGTANIRGGLANNAILANIGDDLGFSDTEFDVYGMGLAALNPTAGTYYSDTFTNPSTGVWWDLTGTLANGTTLSAHYFDANGTTDGPAHLNLISSVAAAPEPGALALLGAVPPLGMSAVVLRSSRRRSRC